VRPVRATDNRKVYRERWWQYAEARRKLVASLKSVKRCLVAAGTTKYLNFSVLPANYVFSHALFIFTTDRWDLYAVVQSTLHEVWARKYSGALETRLRYSPSDCFETFPFPAGMWQTANAALAGVGEAYHEHRRGLMRQLWLGLTDIYNLFHAADLSPALVAKVSKQPAAVAEAGYHGLLELRRLHVVLDEAVRDAYGWGDREVASREVGGGNDALSPSSLSPYSLPPYLPILPLSHTCHEVETLPENDRVRYTISPSARKEVLARLLALNHQRAAEEAEAEKAKGKVQSGKGKDKGVAKEQMGLL
jgi:hypothetical protein